MKWECSNECKPSSDGNRSWCYCFPQSSIWKPHAGGTTHLRYM